jgi:hypothetical protein
VGVVGEGGFMGISVEIEIVPEQCYTCGAWFGLEKHFRAERISDGKAFYCPSGHEQNFIETEADRLKRDLAEKQKSMEYWREKFWDRAPHIDHLNRQINSLKGAITKMKRGKS